MEDDHGMLRPGGIIPLRALNDDSHGSDVWLTGASLSIVVVGASGDLAKKKTFPSLLNLYDDNLLPKQVRIWGYARSELTDEELRERIRPFLISNDHSEEVVDRFLKDVCYQQGSSYGDEEAFQSLAQKMDEFEETAKMDHANRLFYFAIPPNAFGETAMAIKSTSMQQTEKGWTRLIVEKPFGRDLESFEELNQQISSQFTEDHIYRIDHYLGKEMVQNLTVLRFSNTWFERVWNAQNIQCVILTFKEPFGTEGRGGYFDQYGIIRDILQNHLMQVLTLMTMETPSTLHGPASGKAIRDAKVAVLNAISEIELEDVVLGQYEGYADDPTIENKETNTPTFAVVKLEIHNPRWYGVPIILKAGKALNERKAEMRIQFKDAPAAQYLFAEDCPRNELVMRMQPHEAVYMKTNVKSPGFAAKPIQSELEVNYDTRFFAHQKESNPDAYTRLILDVLQGKQGAFVRDDELRRAWEIFTPLLHRIESENVKPIIYKKGTRGPKEADEFILKQAGYIRNEDYVFYEGGVARKTEGTNVAPVATKEPRRKVPMDGLCDVGIFGMALMGQNFALKVAEQGFKVCVGNRTHEKVEATVQRAMKEGNLPVFGADDPEDLVAHLKQPRKIILLVQAGSEVDDAISTLARYMEPGDLIVDAGDEWYENSIRRARFLEPKNIHFLGVGISGGDIGARVGPSLMTGGEEQAYKLIEPILMKSAAHVEEIGPCVSCLGPVGTGHYVKMVHNVLENGDMQLIAEIYDVLKHVLEMQNEEIADLFDEWNKTELSSYLIEMTSAILRKKDNDTAANYTLDYIVDNAGSKGTGYWTVQDAAGLDVAIPTIAGALDYWIVSRLKEERESASALFPDPTIESVNKEQLLRDLKDAVYSSKICLYAQGLNLIRTASDERRWKVDLAECVRVWMGGSIIRAKFLGEIRQAYSENPNVPNLIAQPRFSKKLNEYLPAWRNVVALCVSSGISCPALSNSLTYFDTYRRARLPVNLIQAQRDFFGGHSFERVDVEGRFHVAWTKFHKDIGADSERDA